MCNIILIVTSTFGLEAVVKREVLALGFKNITVYDGRVEFPAVIGDIPKLNLWLRSADRVLLKMGEFRAADFDQLFDQTKALPWDRWLTRDGKITVIGKSVKSKLESIRANQSIVKKAILEKLKIKYPIERFPETGPEFTVQVALFKDAALLTLDTSGTGLHRRGYRKEAGEVPIRENLAAALVLLSFWNQDRILIDPMCGAGTILIEAAMIARRIAPGLNRTFAAEHWPEVGLPLWSAARDAARAEVLPAGNLKIFGYDIDPERIKGCRGNARRAGVEEDIIFVQKDVTGFTVEQPDGCVITNPPYGIKLAAGSGLQPIYQSLSKALAANTGWSVCVVTADKAFPKVFKRGRPDKIRKLYNGTIQVNYYQYWDDDSRPRS